MADPRLGIVGHGPEDMSITGFLSLRSHRLRACRRPRDFTARSVAFRRPSGACGPAIRTALLALLLAGLCPGSGNAGVLSDEDWAKVSQVKKLLSALSGDFVETMRTPGLSAGDADCMLSLLRNFSEASEELGSYVYLITIETKVSDYGDDSGMKVILRFAVDKALAILEGEHRHLTQLSDRCARLPLSSGKMRQAVQVIDSATAVLNSIRTKL